MPMTNSLSPKGGSLEFGHFQRASSSWRAGGTLDREAVRDNSPGLQAWDNTPETRPERAIVSLEDLDESSRFNQVLPRFLHALALLLQRMIARSLLRLCTDTRLARHPNADHNFNRSLISLKTSCFQVPPLAYSRRTIPCKSDGKSTSGSTTAQTLSLTSFPINSPIS